MNGAKLDLRGSEEAGAEEDTVSNEVSLPRLYLMRSMYLLNIVLVGSGVVAAFIHRQKPWDPTLGVAFSFWAALAALSALGIRYPLSMLPLLFVQLLYKTFWLLAVYMPLRGVGRSSDMTWSFVATVVLDVIVIPWPYVIAHYVRKPGDAWRDSRRVTPGIATG